MQSLAMFGPNMARMAFHPSLLVQNVGILCGNRKVSISWRMHRINIACPILCPRAVAVVHRGSATWHENHALHDSPIHGDGV